MMRQWFPLLLVPLILGYHYQTVDFTLPINPFVYGEPVLIADTVEAQHSSVIPTDYSSFHDTKYESLVFVGDVMLARNVEQLMNRHGSDYPYRGLELSSLSKQPAVIGNFESSMSENHMPTPAFQMRFSVNQKFLSPLVAAGFTHFSLANNHSLDYGETGYAFAKTELEATHLNPFGHSTENSNDSVVYIDTPTARTAIVALNASTHTLNRETAKMVLHEAARHSDVQIVYIHWGDEYLATHNKAQEQLAKVLVEAGADLIVGHHPHVVQDVDIVDGVLVFYSLGNYIFDQYFSEDVQTGLVLSLELTDEMAINLIPVTTVGSLSQPTLMNQQDHANFLRKLAKRSDPELRESIQSGVIPFSLPVATSTKMAMMMP